MGNTLATMKDAEKSTRRNRKRKIWDRIKKQIVNAGVSESDCSRLIARMKSDIDELVEIASIEHYYRGINDGKNSG